MTQNHAPSARPKSARGDATRTHRSQPKPARAQPILLDRLAAALAQQDVSLKRTALQSVAAAAFGFRNANEFAAADLVPADARYLGRSGAAGTDLLVLHDPIADKPYAVAPDDPETDPTARARQYGVSPYGHLLTLPDLTALEGAVAETPPAKAIQIRYGASLASPEGLITFGGLNMIDLDQRIASYCRATEAGKELFTEADTDADVIRTFLRKVPDAKLNIQPFAPAHAAALAEHADVDTSGLNPFGHLGVVKTPGGDISYFGPTEAVALSKIAAYCRISWSEVADKAGPVQAFTTDEALVNAYFLHQPDETVTLITTPAQIRAEEALAAEAAAQSGSFTAWNERVAEIRRTVEASDPGDHWAEHPVHDLETWRQDVANGDTREGYWPWVAAMIEAAEDDADDGEDGSDEDASSESGARSVNHAVYTRADYDAHHTVSGEYPRDYDTWVRKHVAADTAARDQWLTLDALNQPWSKKLIGSEWDAMLCVHLVTTGSDGRQVVVRKGSVVHVIGHQSSGDPRVTILVAPRVSVTFRPEQRGGYIPLSRAGLRSSIGDLHPLYTRADWVAERGRGARVVAYADWVAEHERLDLRRQQDWFQGGRLSKLNGTQRFTVRVHGIAELPSRAGKPKAVTPYAPGDVVDLHEAEFSGQTGYMILETQDGGRFTLHTRDASGLLPITLLEPQHRVDRRVHPAHDWQAGVKATGLDGVTYQAWLRFVAGSEQRDRWLTMAEAAALKPGDRLTVHIYGETDCQDPRGESFTQTYSPGDTMRFLEATTQDGLVSYAFETEDDGVFTVNLDERGGYLPISQPTAHNAAFDAWLTAVQAEIGPLNQPVQPEDWKRYFHLGYGPVDAVASHSRTRPAIEDPEAFLWQVAEELSRPDLANRADFQDFCAGLKGTVTAAQAAESWTRR